MKEFYGLSVEVYSSLKNKAKNLGKSVENYIEDSKVNYVVFNDNLGKAYEWMDSPWDWVVYGTVEDAETDCPLGPDDRVITEYKYLLMLGLEYEILPGVKYVISSGSSYPINLIMDGGLVNLGYHSGECSDDIKAIMGIPEIKSQLDAIDDEHFDKWWKWDMFTDDENATKEQRLSWLIFDACANAVDGEWEVYREPDQEPEKEYIYIVERETSIYGDYFHQNVACRTLETAKKKAVELRDKLVEEIKEMDLQGWKPLHTETFENTNGMLEHHYDDCGGWFHIEIIRYELVD